uniref:hypothetical protein n=1 Tax=Paractinoplanes polyasparticus TaxID=2856853 RepID=UPI001C842EC1|nr:hypothetical protein [Actinoplanes polyasparticus]
MTPHEIQPGPVTAAGATVLRHLGSDTMANPVALLLRQRAAPAELAHQAFIVLARRKFARRDGAGARDYVERALAAHESATVRRADAAERILLGKLVGRRAKMPLRDQDLVLVLAVDLARELVPERLPELVRVAEQRLWSLLARPDSQGLMRRLRFRRVSRELAVAPENTGPPLRTTTGELLAALVRNDRNRRDRLADEVDYAMAEPVVHAAFAAAARSCLVSADNAAVIRKMAVQVASQSPSILISADVIEQMLRSELDPLAPPPDLGRDLRVEAEMFTTVLLAEWFGLLPSEVHDLIAAAEQQVQ